MTAICRIVRSLFLILDALASAKFSAQSPPCSTKARPTAAAAIAAFRVSISEMATMGLAVESFASAAANAAGSGQVGCCKARAGEGRNTGVATSLGTPGCATSTISEFGESGTNEMP